MAKFGHYTIVAIIGIAIGAGVGLLSAWMIGFGGLWAMLRWVVGIQGATLSLMDVVSTIAVAFAAGSVAVAAISVVLGVSAWKREFIGKRRIELAESALAKFYEAVDVIRAIRNPLGREGEGGTRKRRDGETPDETRMLDQAYVVFERYQSRESLFAQIRSSKYQFMAAFGEEAGTPFDDLRSAVNKVLHAGRMLGRYWLLEDHGQKTKEARQKHYERIEVQEAIFWDKGEGDEINPLIEAAVADIQAIAQRAMEDRGFAK